MSEQGECKFKVAWEEIATRLDDAHAYGEQYLVPKALGRNIWHAILDDAVAQRRQQPVIELPDKHPLRIRAEKAEAELSTLRTTLGWQPIATAPKDGRVVIGFDPARDAIDAEGDGNGVRGVEFMRWMRGCWMDPATYSMKPTHWQPLPTPPADGEGQ